MVVDMERASVTHEARCALKAISIPIIVKAPVLAVFYPFPPIAMFLIPCNGGSQAISQRDRWAFPQPDLDLCSIQGILAEC